MNVLLTLLPYFASKKFKQMCIRKLDTAVNTTENKYLPALSGLWIISRTVGCSDKKRTARITIRSLLNVDRYDSFSSFAYIQRQLSLELKNST